MKRSIPRSEASARPSILQSLVNAAETPLRSPHVIAWMLGAAVLPYFAVRGWLNAAVVPLGLLALLALVRDRLSGAPRAPGSVRLLAWALCAPLLLIALAQLLHGELVPRRFDGPARLALCGALLLWLHGRRVDWLPVAGFALPGAVLAGAVVIFAPAGTQYYWDGRVASYFMDPLMLSQHVAIAAFMCLFLVDLPQQDALAWKALKVLAFVVGLYMVLRTGSRTGWVVMPLATLLWITRTPGMRRRRTLALAAVAVVFTCVLAYLLSATIQVRIDQAIEDVRLYATGVDVDTSIGIRLSLFRIAWEAFSLKPLLGWGYDALPAPQALPGVSALWTPVVQGYYVNSGVHNEWLQNMVYGGLLGLLSRLLLMGVPLVLFARSAFRREGRARLAGYQGLLLVVGYAAASFSSEVFNMVYLSSYYGLLVAAFGAVAFTQSTP